MTSLIQIGYDIFYLKFDPIWVGVLILILSERQINLFLERKVWYKYNWYKFKNLEYVKK